MPSATTVGQLLNSAQDSAAAAERCAGGLWKLAVADPDGTYEELRKCMDYLVTLAQVSVSSQAAHGRAWTAMVVVSACCA